MIHSIWILSVFYRILIHFLFLALFPLQHMCYYFNQPTPCHWTLHVVYSLIFTINLLFLRLIKRDCSRLPFDYIAYSANNTGKLFVFVIYQHKGECNSLIIVLLIFCLSCRVPMDPHVVYCLHIYNTFVVLTTNKPRLFTVIIWLHRILR